MAQRIIRVCVYPGSGEQDPPMVMLAAPRGVTFTRRPISAAHRLSKEWSSRVWGPGERELGKMGAHMRSWVDGEHHVAGFLLDKSKILLNVGYPAHVDPEVAQDKARQAIDELLESVLVKLNYVLGRRGDVVMLGDVQVVMTVMDINRAFALEHS